MSADLDSLTTPATYAEVKKSLYDVLGILGVRTTDWRPSAVTRTIIAACAVVIAGLSTLIALVARLGFLELSSGAWLTLVARYVYGVERITATFAEGTVTLTNSGGGIFTLGADGMTVSTPDGRTFRNVSGFTLGAHATLSVDVRAVTVGSDFGALAGEISKIASPAMTGVTVTNAGALVGLDDEEDPDLRTRCADKRGALSPFGPSDAYGYAARSAVRSDGSAIGVTRIRITKDGKGGVNVYCAGTGGALATADITAIDDAIQTKAAPLAITAQTLNTTTKAITIDYEAWLYDTPGLTQQQILDAIASSIATTLAAQPVGGNRDAVSGYVYHSTIEAAITRAAVNGTVLPVFRAQVTEPSDDVLTLIGDAPVAGVISGIIHQQALETV